MSDQRPPARLGRPKSVAMATVSASSATGSKPTGEMQLQQQQLAEGIPMTSQALPEMLDEAHEYVDDSEEPIEVSSPRSVSPLISETNETKNAATAPSTSTASVSVGTSGTGDANEKRNAEKASSEAGGSRPTSSFWDWLPTSRPFSNTSQLAEAVDAVVDSVDSGQVTPQAVDVAPMALAATTEALASMADPAASFMRDRFSAMTQQPRQYHLPVGEKSLFSTLQLSRWDNVMGPRVMAVWHCKEPVSDELLKYISGRALNGEIGRPESTVIETKFCVLTDIQQLVTAFTFMAKSRAGIKADSCIYSLALLLPMRYLNDYLPLHEVVEDRFLTLVGDLQLLLQKQFVTALDVFTTRLGPVLVNLANLNEPVARLPEHVKIKLTLFGPDHADQVDEAFLGRALSSHLQTSSTVVVGYDPHRVNTMILSLSLFLSEQERRRSRFAGLEWTRVEPDMILQGIILTQPNSPAGSAPSYAGATTATSTSGTSGTANPSAAYQPYIGTYATSTSTTNAPLFPDPSNPTNSNSNSNGGAQQNGSQLLDEDIIRNRGPVTIVDVSAKVVLQTKPFNEYLVTRNQTYLDHTREKLLTARAGTSGSGGGGGGPGAGVGAATMNTTYNSQSSSAGSTGSNGGGNATGGGGGGGNGGGNGGADAGDGWTAGGGGLLAPAKDVSLLVRTLVADLQRIQPIYLREQHIVHFNMLLTRKAVAFLAYADSHPTLPLPDALIRQLRHDLALNAGDFRVVLARAEKLRPGVSFDVLGNPLAMQEKLDYMMMGFSL